MSGWLDWSEVKIKCPSCGKEISALICEDGDPNRDPVVIISLTDEVVCDRCGKKINDVDLNGSDVF